MNINTMKTHKLLIGVFLTFYKDDKIIDYICVDDINITNLQDKFTALQSDVTQVKIVGAKEFAINMRKLIKPYFKSIRFKELSPPFLVKVNTKKNTLKFKKIEGQRPETKAPEKKIYNVLVVDDSKTMTTVLKKLINRNEHLNVQQTLTDPRDVIEEIKRQEPDVITLDIHMPHLSGLDVVKIIKRNYDIPIIMVSSISIDESDIVLECLDSGAMDYIQKPSFDEMSENISSIHDLLLNAVSSKVVKVNESSKAKNIQFHQESLEDFIILIGSSTGGTTALSNIIKQFPAQIPPIVIVQHIPKSFSNAFANRLNKLALFNVSEAYDNQIISKNNVYVAPGGQQLKIQDRDGTQLKLRLTDDDPVNLFKPSVDYLFSNASMNLKSRKVISVILTGMGNDGAQGTVDLKNKLSAVNIVQSEETCVVYGMPKAAFNAGAIDQVLDLEDIPSAISKIIDEHYSKIKKAS